MSEEKLVKIVYTNYKGETDIRTIIPKEMVFSSNEWHKESQWLLLAYDLDKQMNRTFAMKDVRAWFNSSHL